MRQTVKSCGICGTDLHIHNGEFMSRMPLITGHETSGIVVKVGDAVTNLKVGDKVTADNAELCGRCHHCQRGELLFCESFAAHGVHCEYILYMNTVKVRHIFDVALMADDPCDLNHQWMEG